jgi:protein required for attachment to host cells
MAAVSACGYLLNRNRIPVIPDKREAAMTIPLIVVADQSKARFFTADTPEGELRELRSLEHEVAREKAATLASDRPGRSFDSGGQGRHAMSTSVEPMEQEAIRFAKEIGEQVTVSCRDGNYNHLMIIAGARFLGLLREAIDNPQQLRVTEINKNLGQYNAREIRTHLPERL